MKGAVGDGIVAHNAEWSFDSIGETFTEHARRSVPLYDEGHDIICRISDYFVQKNSVVYDLGTSTGLLLAKLAARHERKSGARFIGIDNEKSMIKEARKATHHLTNVECEVGDVNLWDYEPSDLIVSSYTVQFISPRIRQNLINTLYRALNWGGAFLFFEKVRAPDARFQDICLALYTEFKLGNGFSEAEIINKSRSLKGTLEPFSTNGNLDMLRRAGFVDIMTVIKYVPFEGFLAIK
jgi:tRNA (cmo5U34)-methyltransferase